MNLRRWVTMAWVFAALSVCSVRATVHLSSYNFTTNNLPSIYTDEWLPEPYKLRAKIQPNYHATDGWNNNWAQLWSVPGAGSYTVELYWVKYDYDDPNYQEVGPRNIRTITVSSANNAPPTIQWTSSPSTVNEGQPYYVQALGTDSNGNLTQVNVWKAWSPFALNNGGNGWNNYSGNATADSGGQWIQFQARAVDSNGAASGYIYHSVYVNKAPTIAWEVAPYSVNYQHSYSIRARGRDGDGNMTTVNIYRQEHGSAEQPFAFALYGNSSDAYSENPTQATSYRSVTFRAEALDSSGATSGSIYHTVTVNNIGPYSSWSSNMPNTSAQPGQALRVDTFIGQNYTFSLSGGDPDHNLKEVRAYEYAYEDVNGTYVERQSYRHFDTLASDGGPVARTYDRVGGTPSKWHYWYVSIAEDAAGWTDVTTGDNSLHIWLNNRTPAPPVLSSGQSTIPIGQPITLTAAGTDPDRNATQQWLWYRGPDQQPNEWVQLSLSSYVSGTGNTAVNFTFHPPKPGTYYFKTQVNDPYSFSYIYDVSPVTVQPDTSPPAAPTNLAITGVTPTWVVLTWTKSIATDVLEQHVYWQSTAGGILTDIWIGPNPEGVSVTGLHAGGSFRLYVKALDGSGNYSASSNEVLVVTPVPPSITSQPVSLTRDPGAVAVFSVTASGSAPLTYQWLKNGLAMSNSANVSGVNSPSVTLTNLQAANGGTYTVVVSNSGGSVQSGAATLALNSPPSITTHPVSQTVNTGQSVNFTVAATGTQPFTYQWRKHGVIIVGATTSSYTIASVQATDQVQAPGGYTAIVTNTLGSATSGAATLSVTTTPPIRLALQYWQAYDYPGRGLGSGSYEDQSVWIDSQWVEDGHWAWNEESQQDEWVNDGAHWEDGHWDTQSVWVEDSAPDGFYGSRWDTTKGSFGHPVSTTAGAFDPTLTNRGHLLEDYPQGYYYQPFRAHGYAPGGNCNNFHARLYSPAGGLIGNWTFGNGGEVRIDMPMWAYGIGSYRIEIGYSSAAQTAFPEGVVTYHIAAGVTRPPTIVTHPSPSEQTVNAGTTVSYSVSANGVSGYQWYRNNIAIGGAIGAVLTLNTVAVSAAGSYTVAAINGGGETFSSAAVLLVSNAEAADSDGDGIPNGIETLLSTNPQSPGSVDTANATLQLKIIKP